MNGFDAVVCLSGEGIADRRWTQERKEALRESRIGPVGLLARTLAACADRPECLVCASATGIYGADRGAEVLTDDSEPGTDFVAQLCVDWETASQPARVAGIRVVHTRFGVVLSKNAGALAKMLPLFRLGLGGKLGSGSQFMSWITLADVITAIDFIVHEEQLARSINVTSPNPITNAQFTRELGRVLHRPTFATVPEFVLRKVLGEASVLVLGSVRAFPRQLESAGFQFRFPELRAALAHALQ
jgi:uncharacterized protein (TIGR01777 family)